MTYARRGFAAEPKLEVDLDNNAAAASRRVLDLHRPGFAADGEASTPACVQVEPKYDAHYAINPPPAPG